MSAYLHPAHLPTKSYEFQDSLVSHISLLRANLSNFHVSLNSSSHHDMLCWAKYSFLTTSRLFWDSRSSCAANSSHLASLRYAENLDALRLFAGVRGQYCSSDQLPCCLFLDAIICPHTSRYENLLEQEAIEQIVVVQSANNNWMLQRTKIQQRILNTFTPVLCPEMSQRSQNQSSFLLATN